MRIDYRKKEIQSFVDREGSAITPRPGSNEYKLISDKGYKLVFYDRDINKKADINNLKLRYELN